MTIVLLTLYKERRYNEAVIPFDELYTLQFISGRPGGFPFWRLKLT